MDLGIKGRWAIVCAASQGLGRGCAEALAGEGVNLVINARTATTLEQTAAELRSRFPASEVRTVVGDVTDPALRQALLAACPQVDILVNNAGGPPRATSATGTGKTGSRPWTPTCSRPSS